MKEDIRENRRQRDKRYRRGTGGKCTDSKEESNMKWDKPEKI